MLNMLIFFVMLPEKLRNNWAVSYTERDQACIYHLKVIYHPLYSLNNFVTNKSKLPQDGAQVFPYERVT